MFLKRKSNIKFSVLLLSCVFTFSSTLHANTVIVGGGHAGLVDAYLTYEDAQRRGQQVRIKVYEKNSSIEETTAANIWNSHTPDEIVSVVPRGQELSRKLKIPFNQPGGIRINDVPNVNDSSCTDRFVAKVMGYAQDEEGHQKRTNALLKLGKAGMALWKKIYEKADPDLKKVFEESNFNPCCELSGDGREELHKGYRVDLIYNFPDAKTHATEMIGNYKGLGYTHCKILSPDEVVERDPSLAQFCSTHSEGESGNRQWKEGSVAIWRPGGCLDTQTFLPKFVEYLKKAMGTYVSKKGKVKNRFQLKFNKKVTGITYDESGPGHTAIKALSFEDGTQTKEHLSTDTEYVFCPGEAVGTLNNLGFNEPAYAGFAGASLCLNVPIPEGKQSEYPTLNHCMEVHQEGVVLAWQARVREEMLFLGGAGTKAYYGDKIPTTNDEFAKDRNLLQLNMFNQVLPWVVSLALERDTQGQTLTELDMDTLEKKGIAKRWVGGRAVAFDGFPTVGHIYHEGKLVSNGRVMTHLGSGGGSFSLITSLISHYALDPNMVKERLSELDLSPEFLEEILVYGDSRR